MEMEVEHHPALHPCLSLFDVNNKSDDLQNEINYNNECYFYDNY